MWKNYEDYAPLPTWKEFKPGIDNIYSFIRCNNCGTKKYDENRKRLHEIKRFCKFKTCVQYFCSKCKRWDAGWGRIMCPCEMGRSGHGTYDEFCQPSGKKKVRTQRNWKAIK